MRYTIRFGQTFEEDLFFYTEDRLPVCLTEESKLISKDYFKSRYGHTSRLFDITIYIYDHYDEIMQEAKELLLRSQL